MALIHKATLVPTKLELLSGWLPGQSWFPKSTDPAELRPVGAYRFDDPANEVGIEAILLRAGDGPVLHAPMTYRSAPVAGAEGYLIGTTAHSVLGTRWVYDGCGDPIWAAALATAVLTGGTQVEELVQTDGDLVPRRPSATVSGSGSAATPVGPLKAVTSHDEGETTVIRAEGLELIVVRVVGAELPATPTLTGRWGDGESAVLAGARTL